MRESCCVLTPQDRFSRGGLLLCCADSELFLPWTDHCSGYIYRALECRVRCKPSAVSPSGTCSGKRQVSPGIYCERCVCSSSIRQILNPLTSMMNLSPSKNVEQKLKGVKFFFLCIFSLNIFNCVQCHIIIFNYIFFV